jgi:hypothetical protein
MDAEVDRLTQVADLASQYAREGMPEEQRQLAEDNIARMQGQALSGVSSLGGGLRGLAGATTSTAQAYRNLSAQDAAIAQQNQGRYLGALGALGMAEGAAEQFNEIQPYQQKLAEHQAYLAAGPQQQYQNLMFNYQNQMQQQQMAMDLLGSMIGAGGQVGGTLAMASDRRLKENITHTGYSPSGIPEYTFTYKNDPTKTVHKGTMAQDLLNMGMSDAIWTDPVFGYYAVYYDKIDVNFE